MAIIEILRKYKGATVLGILVVSIMFGVIINLAKDYASNLALWQKGLVYGIVIIVLMLYINFTPKIISALYKR